MAELIKIGHTFINLARVVAVEDHFTDEKHNRIVVRFGTGDAMEFTGRDADDLRTWLNAKASNLREYREDRD